MNLRKKTGSSNRKQIMNGLVENALFSQIETKQKKKKKKKKKNSLGPT